MSTNLPADKPESKPAQIPAPSTSPDKAALMPHAGTARPDPDPKREADKVEPKKTQE